MGGSTQGKEAGTVATSKGMHWKRWSPARRATACVMAATLVFTLAWPGVSPFESSAYAGSGGTDVSSSNHTIVSSSQDFVSDELALKLNYSTFTGTSGIESSDTDTQSKVKKKNMPAKELMVLYVDNSDNFTKGSSTSSGKNSTSTWSSLNAQLEFENVCTIGGVQVDATVTIKRVKIGKHLQYSTGSASTTSFLKNDYETEDASQVGIAHVTSGGLYIGTSSALDGLKGYCWVAQRDVRVNVTLTWDSDLSGSVDLGSTTAKAGKTVDLDFYTYITDIDINNMCTEESWSYDSDDGFRTAKAYRAAYDNTVLKQSTSTSDGVTTRKYWHWRSSDEVTDKWGNTVMCEYDTSTKTEQRCGVYTQTNGGTFTSTFGVSLCAMKLTAYSQYDSIENPKKFIYKNSNFKSSSQEDAGDTITWYVTWQMGTAWSDTTQPYSALRIVDDLPTGKVKFNKAVMYRGKRANIAANSSSDYTKLATITSSDTSDYSDHPNNGSGTLEYDSGTVRFIFDSDWLNGSDDGASDGSDWADNYWGQYYTMVITVTIKDSVSGGAEIVNSATTKVNGVPYDSSEVVTTVKETPVPATPTLSLTKTTCSAESISSALAESTITANVAAELSGYESEVYYDESTNKNLVWTRLSGAASSSAWVQWALNSSLTFYFQLQEEATASNYVCAVIANEGDPLTVSSISSVTVYVLDYAPEDDFTQAEGWSTKASVSSLTASSPAEVVKTTAGDASAKWLAYNDTAWWRVKVTASDADAENVVVTDTLPAYLNLVSASVKSTSSAEGEQVASITTGAGGSFTVTADSLEEDGSIVVWCETTLASSSYVRRNVTNTAYATCDDWDDTASGSDTVAYYEAGGSYTVTEVPSPALSITKEAEVEVAVGNAEVDYDYYNTKLLSDDYTLEYIQLTSNLAANESLTMRTGSYAAITFSFDEMIPTGSYLVFPYESPDYSSYVYALSSLDGASDMELDEVMATAFAVSGKITSSKITSVRKTKYVKAGEVVKWTVTVENIGESDSTATSLVLADNVPEGLTLITSSGTYGPKATRGSSSLSVSTSGDTWATASTTLSAGTTVTVTFYTTVDEGYEWQVLKNTATATASNASEVSASDWVTPYEPDEPTKYQKTVGWDETASDLDWSNGNFDKASAVLARYDDTIFYRIEQDMPLLAYDVIAFADTLPAELEYESMSVYLDDEDVTSCWNVVVGERSADGTAIEATCSSPDSSWFEETLSLVFEIECSIADDAEAGYFRNAATVAFDSISASTNEVWTNLWLASQSPDISITKTAEVTPSPEDVCSESDYVSLEGYDGTSSSSGDTVLYLYLALSEDLAEGSWVCWQPGWSGAGEDDEDEGTGEDEDDGAVTFDSAAGTYWFQAPADLTAGQWVALGFDEDGTLTYEVTAFSELPEGGTGTSLGTAELTSADYKYVKAGTSFWWSVEVEEGNEYATAGHVVVSDVIPEELEYVSGSLSSTLGTASFDEATDTWTVDLGEPGQPGEYAGVYSFEVRFQTTAPEAHDDAIVNTASVTADGGLSAEASDEVVVYVPSEQLPTTGSLAMRALGATAGVAALAGACVAVHARRRRKQRERLVRNFHRV